MATRLHSLIQTEDEDYARVRIIEWTGLLNGDDGEWIRVPFWADKCVHAYGTYGAGGNVKMEGTALLTSPSGNQVDSLADQGGAIINMTDVEGGRIATILDNTVRIRPRVSAGDGTTSITVRLVVKRDSR
jgi:hypothetical protein